MDKKETGYVTTILDAAAHEMRVSNPEMAKACEIAGWVMRGWTLDAARHQVNVVQPRLLESGGKLR